ncbi:hypothetical protein MOV63_27930, partial [Neorhizobium sp. SHOUNA12A]|nr:hypothetical protein [Neorhizobium sp. SHOUNA12A]
MNAEGTLADRLYEAALVPELWTETCERIALEAGSSTASIFTVDGSGNHRYVTTPNIADAFAQFVRSDTRLDNVRPLRAMQRSPFSFVRVTDLLSAEEFANDAIQRDIIEPHGMRWEAGWAFQEPTGHVIVITLMRAKGLTHFSDEQLARLDLLKPDLARAAYMSSRLAFNEARSMTETLSMLGLPAAVIGDAGRAIAMNPEMEALSPRIRTGAGDRLILEGVGANALLEEAIAHYKAQAAPAVQSLPMAGR